MALASSHFGAFDRVMTIVGKSNGSATAVTNYDSASLDETLVIVVVYKNPQVSKALFDSCCKDRN